MKTILIQQPHLIKNENVIEIWANYEMLGVIYGIDEQAGIRILHKKDLEIQTEIIEVIKK